ncbi:MAG: type II toxin-antitoxin system VapC family toxin [Thermodesulfobacteriota bacterium]
MTEPWVGIRRLFLDSAPVIYFVEQHPDYHSLLLPIFARFETGDLIAVTSPITLAECLVLPLKAGNAVVTEAFLELLGGAYPGVFVALERQTARLAAEIRSKYRVTLSDAFQVASALEARCQALLTNDKALTRITELRVLVVEDLR